MAGKMAVKMAGSGFLTRFVCCFVDGTCLTYDFSSRFCQTVVLEGLHSAVDMEFLWSWDVMGPLG